MTAPNPPSTRAKELFHVGDLVRVSEDALKYFAGKLAIVISEPIKAFIFEIESDYFYEISLVKEQGMHVFAAQELILVSRVIERSTSSSVNGV